MLCYLHIIKRRLAQLSLILLLNFLLLLLPFNFNNEGNHRSALISHVVVGFVFLNDHFRCFSIRVLLVCVCERSLQHQQQERKRNLNLNFVILLCLELPGPVSVYCILTKKSIKNVSDNLFSTKPFIIDVIVL